MANNNQTAAVAILGDDGTGTGKSVFIPYTEDLADDELYANLQRHAAEYEAARVKAAEAEFEKDAAKAAINDSLAVLAIFSRVEVEEVSGIVLGPVQDNGKQKVWEKTSRRGSAKVDPALLLQAGVGADVIARCTVTGEGSTSWSVKEVLAKTVAKKVLEGGGA